MKQILREVILDGYLTGICSKLAQPCLFQISATIYKKTLREQHCFLFVIFNRVEVDRSHDINQLFASYFSRKVVWLFSFYTLLIISTQITTYIRKVCRGSQKLDYYWIILCIDGASAMVFLLKHEFPITLSKTESIQEFVGPFTCHVEIRSIPEYSIYHLFVQMLEKSHPGHQKSFAKVTVPLNYSRQKGNELSSWDYKYIPVLLTSITMPISFLRKRTINHTQKTSQLSFFCSSSS